MADVGRFVDEIALDHALSHTPSGGGPDPDCCYCNEEGINCPGCGDALDQPDGSIPWHCPRCGWSR